MNRNRPYNESRYHINGPLEVLQGSFTSRSFQPHFHESYAFILVENGIADYGYKKQDYIVNKNNLLLLNPYDVHTGKSIGEGIWHFRSLYVPSSMVKKLLHQMDNEKPIFTNHLIKDAGMLAIFQTLHHELITTPYNLLHEEKLATWLNVMAKKYGIRYADESGKNEARKAELMRDFIMANYQNNVQLDDLSDVAGLSRFHLIKVFQKRFGLTPHRYLTILRIEKAKNILSEGMSSTDTAFRVGFFDQSHFIRHFKSIVGVTPSAYC